MSFLLALLNTSALCVAQTGICAPEASKLTGQITSTGGAVTIVPSAPMKALGAEFPAGVPLEVSVQPWWSSDKKRGAIVHVSGELARPSTISGVTVSGDVRIGQLQGRPGAPQLVQAKNMKGALQVFSAGTIDVGPGMRLVGALDFDGGVLELTSPSPLRAGGLDFAAGTVRIEQHTEGASVSGTLARVQSFAGLLVDGRFAATITGQPRLHTATLGGTTPLELLGLPKGIAPAGTTYDRMGGTTALRGPGPFTVCGLALRPAGSPGPLALSFGGTAPRPSLYAQLVDADVEVVPGVHLTGTASLTFDAATCRPVQLEGALAQDAVQEGVRFAAKSAFMLADVDKDRVVRGTIAGAATIDKLTLKGSVTMQRTSAGGVRILEATLAKTAPFEQWQLPAGTHLQTSDADNWSFEVPRGSEARAIAAHRGHRVDRVRSGTSDGETSTFVLAAPHRLAGTNLSFANLGIVHATGCVLGGVSGAQRIGILSVPAKGNVTVCGGAVVHAEGVYAVPTLRVGSWYATAATADVAGSLPPTGASRPMGAAPSGPLAGYWIQINSLCQAPTGIPVPPPPQRWIWVDLKGQALAPADRQDLTVKAARPGKPCPSYPCCVP